MRKMDTHMEKIRIQEEIKKISDNAKKRIQMYIDPRSTKIRHNFRVLNENLAEIRKIDPTLQVL